MKHRYYPILLLYFFQAACMPEEDLPIRHTGETPEYFIECYCQPGRPFALSCFRYPKICKSTFQKK